MFGCSPELVSTSGEILHALARDWRDLVAGSEGFLTDERHAGLHRQAIVWGQHDSFQHVNNVHYVRFAESGRCNWARNIGTYHDRANKKLWDEILTPRGVGLILKSISVNFKFPMTWPDRVSVYHKIHERPTEQTKSLVLDVLIMSEGKQRPAARCREDIVVYDYKAGQKTSLPPFMLKQFTSIFDLQEQTRKANLSHVEDLSQRIRQLEQGTWDRPEAKEAFG